MHRSDWDELAVFTVKWCPVCMESTAWKRDEDGVLRCVGEEHEARLEWALSTDFDHGLNGLETEG